jgi:acetyl esterase/lipase
MAGPRGGVVVAVLAGLLAGCAGPASDRVMITTAPTGAREEIPITIDRPRGPGPFPAVVGTGTYHSVAPLLILIGEKDDWTPAAPCVKLAASTRATEHPVTIMIYPGAHHSFDSDRPARFVDARVNNNAPGGHGATTGGDADAWADSIRRVAEFFGRHLGP